MVAVIGAMDAEIAGIRSRMRVTGSSAWGVTRIVEGRLCGVEVCLVRSGVGKAMAAATAAHVLSRFSPVALLYVGIAGALDPSLEIGDLVIASDCLQHDLDATVFGFARGEVPYDGLRVFSSDPKLLGLSSSYSPATGRVVVGRILTGDQFCSAADRREHRYFTEELGGIAIEMEGAGAAVAAALSSVPFLLARIISDRADGTAPSDFSSFLPGAADRIADFVVALLGRM